MFSRRTIPSLVLIGLAVFTQAASAAPALPTINTNNVITITNAPYNAVGDNATDNTIAISNAIFTAASGGLVGGLRGGTVRIPATAGAFLTGPQTLRNNVNIQIDAGATLRMLPLNLYTNYPGQNQMFGNLFYALTLTNISITGSGTIDGQGLPWWNSTGTLFSNRPYMIYFNSGCKQILIQDVTILNSPAQLVVFKGRSGNITVQGITESTPSSLVAPPNASHNTDGIDLVGTNILVQNCNISVGDDNLALGTSSANTPTADLLVTNCAFGEGHGLSIGSNTAGGVSNLTVINCTFNGTEYGIRMKSDNNTSGGSGQGGITENLNYYNIGMTNIVRCPILIYSFYSEYGTPTSVTPFMASTQLVESILFPIWRNITISNLTATVSGSGIAGMIWGRNEMPATNIILSHINITAPKSFDVYNAYGIQFIDSQLTVSGGNQTLATYNSGIIVSNTSGPGGMITIDGLTSTNSLTLYNAQASMTASDVLGTTPITLNGSTLTVSNSLNLPASASVNFSLGTNAAKIVTTGNLALNSTLNLSGAGGFGPGNYRLFTYNGSLSGTPLLGTIPSTSGHSWLYNLNTSTPGQVNFVVSTPPSPTFSNLTVNNGTNVVVAGTGGTTNFNYIVLTSTNVAVPLSQWSSIYTNQFDPAGNFSFSNAVSAGSPQRFYLIQYP
jgi:polygalacturonase